MIGWDRKAMTWCLIAPLPLVPSLVWYLAGPRTWTAFTTVAYALQFAPILTVYPLLLRYCLGVKSKA